ncbi:MAG: hypothetical protein MI922_27485 [Bacteroidales bacterium]|nr:hypothetical protein [Bacteroidales bacterium]
MIEYCYNDDLRLLEVQYSGEVSKREIIHYGEAISNDTNLPRKLKILTDATKAHYTSTMHDVDEIVSLMKIHTANYEYIRAAFLQSRPKETALSYLLETKLMEINYFHKIFVTREAAINWLNEP